MGKMVKIASLLVSVWVLGWVPACGKPDRREANYPTAQQQRDWQAQQQAQKQRDWEEQRAQQQAQQQAQRRCTADDGCGAGSLCVRGACAEITADMAECGMVRVFFETDSAELTAQGQERLRRIARCIQANQPAQVLIEGNADRRGPEGYNYTLGDRRATTVANFLAEQGVSGEQLRTVSYGETNPLCWDQDQDCMAKNRRAAVRTRPRQTAGRRKQPM